MVQRDELVQYIDTHLAIERFDDASLNGLQVEGKNEVRTLALAVDSGASVIDRAIDLGADLLIVHHGLMWQRPFAIRGEKRRVLARMLSAGLNLYAAHLPLDAHPVHGNNAVLATILELGDIGPSAPYRGAAIGVLGRNARSLTVDDIIARLLTLPGAASPMHALRFGPEVPVRISIVSGAGCDQLQRASVEKFDTLITGEPRQFAYHTAKEERLNVIFAGHYASETTGVQALGKHLAERFGLTAELVHEPTGI